MADRIEVDPEALEKAAHVTADLAKSVKGVVRKLTRRLDAIEIPSSSEPWGGDQMGKSFLEGKAQNGYGSAKKNLLAGVNGIQTTLEEFAAGQTDASKVLRGAEGNSTYNIKPQPGPRGGRRSGPASD